MIKKIITHSGIFHADDAMSIALIKEFVDKTIPVERTRNISTEDLNNPDIWIVDVGGKYDDKLNNYDHHQDNRLPAACMIVLNELVNMGLITLIMQEELIDAVWEISDIDCNGPDGKNGFQVNSLIKSFNALENGWDIAVDVFRKHIQACKESVAKMEVSREIWDAGERVSTFIRVCDAFPIHWKRYNEEILLIYPDEGKWTLISGNSEYFPITASGKQSYIHTNKFLAVYNTKEDAIDDAQRTALNAVG